MTMQFPVTDRRLLDVARAGDLVRFTVVTRDHELVIIAVEREDGERTTSTGARVHNPSRRGPPVGARCRDIDRYRAAERSGVTQRNT